jgi:hypothetical protein
MRRPFAATHPPAARAAHAHRDRRTPHPVVITRADNAIDSTMTSPPASLLESRLAALSDRVELRTTPAHGRSLFAARDFAAGEEIFSEAALFCASPTLVAALNRAAAVSRARVPGAPPRSARAARAPPPLPLPFSGALVSSAALDADARALDALAPAAASALTAADAPRGVCPLRLSDVLRVNGAEADVGAGDAAPLTAVLLVLSMVNHACAPSAGWRSAWDAAARAPRFSVRAARALRAGEEVTFAYVAADAPRRTRAARLRAGWGFACDCARCDGRVRDDAAAAVCAACGGPVRFDGGGSECDAVGCIACGASWAAAGFPGGAAAARSARDDAIWWLENEGGAARLAAALATVHATDASLRAALRPLLADALDGALPCACAADGLAAAARAVRDGAAAAKGAVAPSLDVATHALCGDVSALLAAARGARIEAPVGAACDCPRPPAAAVVAARGDAARAYAAAAAAARRAGADAETTALLDAAAASPPASHAALRDTRRARDAAAAAAATAAHGAIDASLRARLWVDNI